MGNDTKSAHLHSPQSFPGFGHHRNADIKMGRRGTAQEGGGTCARSCVQRAPEAFGITQQRAGTPRAGIHTGKPAHTSSCPAVPSSSSWAQLINKKPVTDVRLMPAAPTPISSISIAHSLLFRSTNHFQQHLPTISMQSSSFFSINNTK